MDKNDSNDPVQSAYRPTHSTLIRINEAEQYLMRGAVRCGLLLVLLGLNATFDTLDHGILRQRLRGAGLSYTVIAWFTSYLVGRETSIPTRQNASLQRASQTVFHRDPLSVVQLPPSSKLPIYSNVTNLTEYHVYADDTQLYAEFHHPNICTQTHCGAS